MVVVGWDDRYGQRRGSEPRAQAGENEWPEIKRVEKGKGSSEGEVGKVGKVR